MDHIERYAIGLAVFQIWSGLVDAVRHGKVLTLVAVLLAVALEVPIYGRIWGWW